MATDPLLLPQPPGFKGTIRTQFTILDYFKRRLYGEEVEQVKQEIEREKEQYETGNMLRLRRVYHTPTLFIVAPLQREETHRVVRKYKKYKDFFFRLNLVTDNIDKVHFGSIRMASILEFMIRLLATGVSIGG